MFPIDTGNILAQHQCATIEGKTLTPNASKDFFIVKGWKGMMKVCSASSTLKKGIERIGLEIEV